MEFIAREAADGLVYVCGLCLETYTSSDGCYMSNMSSRNVTVGYGTQDKILWVNAAQWESKTSHDHCKQCNTYQQTCHSSRADSRWVWNSNRFSSFSGCFTFLITHNPHPVNLTSSPSHKGSWPRPGLLSPPPNLNSRRASRRRWWRLLGYVTCHSSTWLV